MNYSVRRAELSDIESIMHIEHASFAPSITEAQSVFEERLTVARNGNRVLYTPENGRVYGYCTTELWEEAEDYTEAFRLGHSTAHYHRPQGCVLYISSFAILPELRGQKVQTPDGIMGVAKLFFRTSLSQILTEYPQVCRIVLLVHEDWHTAQRLYESQDFLRMKTLSDFSGFAGKKAFIYEKMLEHR